MNVGTRVVVEKGCRAYGIDKGCRAVVKAVEPLGPDYSHNVAVTLFMLSGFNSGKTFRLHARHMNRLSDPVVNLSALRPEHTVKVRVVQ